MNKWAIVGIVAILVILAGGGYFLSQKGAQSSPTPAPTTAVQATPEVTETPMAMEASSSGTASSSASSATGTTKSFTVTGSSFKFVPNQLTVDKGDKVSITFKSTGGFHDFTLEGYNVATKQISTGQSDTVTFTADKAGTFTYFCSVDGHRAQGMTGTLTVK